MRAKVGSQEISRNGDAANLWIKVHPESAICDLADDRLTTWANFIRLRRFMRSLSSRVQRSATRGSHGTVRRGAQCKIVGRFEPLARCFDDELEVSFPFGLRCGYDSDHS